MPEATEESKPNKWQLWRNGLVMLRNYLWTAGGIAAEYRIPAMVGSSLAALLLIAIHFALIWPVTAYFYKRETQNLMLVLFAIPFDAYILSGLLQFYVKLVREGEADISKIFQGYRRYFHVLLYVIAYYLAYRGLVREVELETLAESSLAMSIRLLFGIPLFLWLIARLSFAPLFAIDQSQTLRGGLRESFLMTSGHTVHMIVLMLGMFVLVAVGSLPLVLGLNVSLPPPWSYVLLLAILPALLWTIYTGTLLLTGYVLAFDFLRKSEFSRGEELVREVPGYEHLLPDPKKRKKK